MRNRLAEETSPYLLQHAANPVHWRAWDEASLADARNADKPILLSIGYSACHWCHVMAHESFEDDATAQLMNELYVNVKVDREERPDIDKIYQTAHQLYSGRPGGWPLTVFLTPDDHVPIFIGTYFPKEPRYGMPAFRDVLKGVEAYYRSSRGEIRTRGTALAQAFEELAARGADDFVSLSRRPLELARARLGKSYDRQHGGFGAAPKFPHAPMLELLLAHWRRSSSGGADDEALEIVTHSLDRMALAGLYDQLGGGFYRYSVDREWSIPHFEKMLYDNAALLPLYADAFAATGSVLYRRVASETADWAIRDMQDPRGGFYSTLDADSEHEEGKFYVWARDELDALLSADESRVAKRVLGLGGDPNFEQRFWHLRIATPADEAAAELGLEPSSAADLFAGARAKLLAARNARVWPGRDDKILVSWNGLMIAGLARAARVLGRDDLAVAATRAVDFVRAELWEGGRLRATYKDGRARFAAYLDDYAFLAAGLLELLQCRWRGSDLELACALVDALLTHFEDRRGGFFFTADDHETLIHKPKPFADEAVPSGNGVAAGVLVRLGHLTGEQRYLDAAERTIRAAWGALEQYPEGHATLLHALDELLSPPQLVVVRAPKAELDPWRAALGGGYEPHRLAVMIPTDADGLRGLLAERTARPTGGVAYVCEGMTCRAPLDTPAALADALAPAAR